MEKVAKNKLTAKEIEYFAAIRNELSKDKGSNLIEIAERFGIKPKRDIIADRKKSWERTQTFKMFGDKRSKGITVNPPFELTWKGPGCREKYVNIKIIQPINNQIWKDLWVAVEDRQEDAFGKIPKGRPKSRPYRRKSDKKIYDTLEDPIKFLRAGRKEEHAKGGKEIYGSHVDSSWWVNFSNASTKNISEKLATMSKRGRKFFCYSLSRMRKSNRELGRMFKVSKDTVGNWIADVDTWPKAERKAVESELRRSKCLSNKDVYDASEAKETLDENEAINPQNFPAMEKAARTALLASKNRSVKKRDKILRSKILKSVDDVDYALTNQGLYNQGRKKKHKPSDQKD